MSSPPSPYEHPGSPPVRPELPEGVERSPAVRDAPDRPPWPAWAPFAALLTGLIVALVGQTIVLVFASAFGWSGDHQTPAMTIIGTVIQDVGFIGGAVAMAWVTVGRPTPAQFGLRPANVVQAIGGVVGAYVTFQVVALLWALVVDTSQKQDILDQLGANRSDGYLAASAVVVCVLAPIAEEILFRGFFFTALRNAMPTLLAAISTGVLFGLVHVIGTPFPLIVPLAVLGFVLCLLYLYTGSLLPCMALHSINNAIAFGVSLKWPLAATLALVIAAPTLVVSIGLLAARSKRLALPAPATA
jgi:membrane protease YdiL (CAAX protease family)